MNAICGPSSTKPTGANSGACFSGSSNVAVKPSARRRVTLPDRSRSVTRRLADGFTATFDDPLKHAPLFAPVGLVDDGPQIAFIQTLDLGKNVGGGEKGYQFGGREGAMCG